MYLIYQVLYIFVGILHKNMERDKLITGVRIAQQMSKARNILNSEVIPKDELNTIREREGRLSQELLSMLKQNT